MPLVVPGLQSKDGNSGDDWMSKLMGKKLGDQHDEMVSRPPLTSLSSLLSSPYRHIRLSFSVLFSLNVSVNAMLLLDLRKDRSSPATPRSYARLDADNGLPAREVECSR
jgi:hypothetical protein